MKYLNDVSYKDCVGKVCKSLIYIPESEYYEYEGALKFILSKWMEAEWEEV